LALFEIAFNVGLSVEINPDSFVKSILKVPDGLWKMVDIRGVVFVEVLRLYMWYVVKSQQTYNEVDRTFYESINPEDYSCTPESGFTGNFSKKAFPNKVSSTRPYRYIS
jgi:hypothetical protein